jgi:hypothetical protein
MRDILTSPSTIIRPCEGRKLPFQKLLLRTRLWCPVSDARLEPDVSTWIQILPDIRRWLKTDDGP